jgi:hypothetical protein
MQLSKMLGNPTLENVDNSAVMKETRNGDILRKLKEDISLEMPFERVYSCNYVLIDIIGDMDKLRDYTRKILMQKEDINLAELQHDIEQIPLPSKIESKCSEPENLFELVYLKLIQHENMGRTKDIESINVTFEDYPKANQLFDSLVKDVEVPTYEAKEYLMENRNRLAIIVFEKSKLSSNEFRKYDTAVTNIDKMIDVVCSNTMAKGNYLPEKLLITILQVYIHFDKNHLIENFFYGYKSGDQKSLNTEKKRGSDAFHKNQIAISKFIFDTLYKKSGHGELLNLIYQFESHTDKVGEMILSCNSIEKMRLMYDNIKDKLRVIPCNAIEKMVNSKLNSNYTFKVDKDYRDYKDDSALWNLACLFLDNRQAFYKVLEIFNERISYVNEAATERGAEIYKPSYGYKFGVFYTTKELILKEFIYAEII